MSDAVQGWHDAQFAAELERLREENARIPFLEAALRAVIEQANRNTALLAKLLEADGK